MSSDIEVRSSAFAKTFKDVTVGVARTFSDHSALSLSIHPSMCRKVQTCHLKFTAS